MKRVHARASLAIASLVVAGAAGAGLGTTTQAHAGGPSSDGAQGTASSAKSVKAAAVGSAPSTFKSVTLRGGYTAAGVSLRNRGKGTINLSGIPAGASVESAYLMWSVLGGNTPGANFKKGKFRGVGITGTLVGSGDTPCWNTTTKGYSYRANVTSLVKYKKNGAYGLSSFASGVTNATDAWTNQTPPLAEGASLVVVYKKSTYPITKVLLSSGYGMTTSNVLTKTVNFGFAATNPVGEVKTTFIGGDGQSADEAATTFNGVPLPSVTWDGNDRPFPKYSLGNLWDTQTVKAVDLVKPGHTSATLRVTGGNDCLVWTGQAFSIGRYGQVDTDGDKLKDGWEANGYDSNGDKIADVPLPGASPVHKDLFVEMDWMGPANDGPSHLAQNAELARITSVFGSAPYAKNPDGLTGIRLHLDAGNARAAQYNLGGGNQVPFDDDLNPAITEFNAIRAANFDPRRAKIYYYMIWAHGYDGGTSSGNAFNIPNDRFLVTLGKWNADFGTPDQKVGTFIHEFGHALGQRHGGNDHRNYKPNYLSVMNYSFQVSGIGRTGGLPAYFGFSSSDLPDLYETALKESAGLKSVAAKTYRTKWFCPNGAQATNPGRSDINIDWNCSGVVSGTKSVDINNDGAKNTLQSYNNWANITYGGGAVGGGVSAASSSKLMKELTLEEAKKLAK